MSIAEPSFDSEYYNRHGFCRIRSLFAPELIEHLRELCSTSKNDSSFVSFKKNRYNVGLTDARVGEVLRDQRFTQLVTELAGRSLVFTDGIIFEIDHRSSGFDWHIGITSFKYIGADDDACTLWIPLDPIDPSDQDGGVSLVSMSAFSGREFYKLQRAATASMHAGRYSLEPVYRDMAGCQRFSGITRTYHRMTKALARRAAPHTYSESLYFSSFSKNLLERERQSFSYDVGDALLFHKHVFHRSNRLKEGALPTRRAFVMRFVDVDASYDEINDKVMGGESSQIIERIKRGHGRPFDLNDAVVLQRQRMAAAS